MASTVIFFNSLRTRLTRILCNIHAHASSTKNRFNCHMTYFRLLFFWLRQQQTDSILKKIWFFGNIFTPSDRALNTDRALFKSLTLSDTATATGTADFTTDTVTWHYYYYCCLLLTVTDTCDMWIKKQKNITLDLYSISIQCDVV